MLGQLFNRSGKKDPASWSKQVDALIAMSRRSPATDDELAREACNVLFGSDLRQEAEAKLKELRPRIASLSVRLEM